MQKRKVSARTKEILKKYHDYIKLRNEFEIQRQLDEWDSFRNSEAFVEAKNLILDRIDVNIALENVFIAGWNAAKKLPPI